MIIGKLIKERKQKLEGYKGQNTCINSYCICNNINSGYICNV